MLPSYMCTHALKAEVPESDVDIEGEDRTGQPRDKLKAMPVLFCFLQPFRSAVGRRQSTVGGRWPTYEGDLVSGSCDIGPKSDP